MRSAGRSAKAIVGVLVSPGGGWHDRSVRRRLGIVRLPRGPAPYNEDTTRTSS